MPGVFVSAASKSSGKTTVSTSLVVALSRRGLVVQPYKKGPDYIDPMWLSIAAGRPCRNLDPRLQGEDLAAYFARHAIGSDLAFVEGNHGLHDGFALDGSDSNAAVAKALGLPVIVVLDARGIMRGLAAVLKGLQVFDPEVTIAGAIVNRLASARHETRVREAIERYTDVPVIGALAEQPALSLVERHLGLMPSNEAAEPQRTVARLADTVAASVDIDAVAAIAKRARPPLAVAAVTHRARPGGNVAIGIARDRAFGFYYPDDLDALEEAGARLVPFDTLRDRQLPPVDGLFIGGGFPEMLARPLEANAAMRESIREAIECGLPTYAECGGLMYLSRSLMYAGERREMVGALPLDVVMHAKPVGKGYVAFEETEHHPWPGHARGSVRAHEFHYSSVENVDPGVRFAYRMSRGHGFGEGRDGLVHRNVLASYAHLRSVGKDNWARRFVGFVREVAAMPVRQGIPG